MEKLKVKVKLLHNKAKIPVYSTEGAAGFDIFSIENFCINPGEVKKVSTGLAFEIPQGHCLQIWDRSGRAMKGIHHFGGIIDSDYRGEVSLLLYNSTKEPHNILEGERIVQAMILALPSVSLEETNSLSETKRGSGGFHSTGK